MAAGLHLRRRNNLLTNSTPATKARLHSASGDYAAAWLVAIPTSKNLSLSPLHFATAICLLLGLAPPIALPARCHGPTATGHHAFDAAYTHLSHCHFGGGLIRRHDRMVDAVLALARSASVGTVKEQLHRVTLDGTNTDNPRIDGIIYDMPNHHPELALDITVVSPLKSSGLAAAAATPLAAANAAARAKNLKWRQACTDAGLGFLPLVWESFGAASNDTLAFLVRLVGRVDGDTWCAPNWAASTPDKYWWQRLAITLQRNNARMVTELAGQLVRLYGSVRRGL
jgi:hypothetical protein